MDGRTRIYGPPPATIEQLVTRAEAIGDHELAESFIDWYTDPSITAPYNTVRALDEILSVAELNHRLELFLGEIPR
jgi:hypothetical protein